MVGSPIVANDVKEYLERMPENEEMGTEGRGRGMMEGRLRRYLAWKASLSKRDVSGKGQKGKGKVSGDGGGGEGDAMSAALAMKEKVLAQRAANRRRVRGGGPSASCAPSASRSASGSESKGKGKMIGGDGMVEEGLYTEAGDFADLYVSLRRSSPYLSWSMSSLASSTEAGTSSMVPIEILEEIDMDVGGVTMEEDIHYGIVPAEELVLVRTYGDDGDDVILKEIKPRYIVMYEPNHEFIRRIEVSLFGKEGVG